MRVFQGVERQSPTRWKYELGTGPKHYEKTISRNVGNDEPTALVNVRQLEYHMRNSCFLKGCRIGFNRNWITKMLLHPTTCQIHSEAKLRLKNEKHQNLQGKWRLMRFGLLEVRMTTKRSRQCRKDYCSFSTDGATKGCLNRNHPETDSKWISKKDVYP